MIRRLLLVAALLAAARGTRAEEGAPPEGGLREALAAAAKVRASLPDPKDAGPLAFEGDLLIAGENAGSVRFAAEPAVRQGQSVWEVAEDVAQEVGGSRSRTGMTLWLARDLTLLGGEISRRATDVMEKWKLERTAKGFAVERTVALPREEPVTSRLEVPAPADATCGRTALWLFLRGAPKKVSARYALPWFAPEEAFGPRGEHDAAPTEDPVLLEVLGGGTLPEGGSDRPTWAAAVRRGGRASEMHLDPGTRALAGVRGLVPPVHVVPLGKAPARSKVDDDAPAATWRAAFLKFGHGYHMGVEAWLDAAFHWPSMWEHESSLPGGWPKERPVEEFRKAWLAEFLAASPKRTRAAADELLAMTLATGRVKEQTEDRVVFAAHAEFGGGVQRTYHLRRIEGVWYIVRMDES